VSRREPDPELIVASEPGSGSSELPAGGSAPLPKRGSVMAATVVAMLATWFA
jgi:hypothetical protein